MFYHHQGAGIKGQTPLAIEFARPGVFKMFHHHQGAGIKAPTPSAIELGRPGVSKRSYHQGAGIKLCPSLAIESAFYLAALLTLGAQLTCLFWPA
jgi:hypothetical protein